MSSQIHRRSAVPAADWTIVGACPQCQHQITLAEARAEPEGGGLRFTITDYGAWYCLRHEVAS